jgi:hypothetical protein
VLALFMSRRWAPLFGGVRALLDPAAKRSPLDTRGMHRARARAMAAGHD